jgi:Tol biopolymer transport system component
MDKPISRKHALALYRDALERGDFNTVAAVLWLAERDPKLVQMIAKFHERVDAPGITDVKPQRGIIEVVRFIRDSSPDGWPPKPDQTEEEPKMYTTFVPAHSPYYGGARKLRWDLIAWAAAILVMAVLGLGLLFMRPPEILPEFAAQPESCMAEGPNPQAESVRLAGEAAALLDAEGDNTELAMLLGICALQTAYSPEADRVLQQVMANEGVAQTFAGSAGVFSPDGRNLLTGDNAVARLWDVATGEEIREFAGHTAFIDSLVFSPDGRFVLSSSGDKTARMWDVETGQEIRQFVGHTATVLTVAFSPDGRYALSGSEDGIPRMWDVETGEEIRRFTGHRNGVFVAFSPNGRYVATGSWDSTVRLWDAATGNELRQFQPSGQAAEVGFSSNGRYLVSSGTNAVRQYNVETGETIREYTAPGSRTLIYANFSPDDRYVLASARDNKLALLWDAETGELVRVFDGRVFAPDAYRMYSVSFSPDGQSIAMATAGVNNAPHLVWLWDTDYHDTVAHACEHFIRDFTAAERAQYGLGEGAACP